MNAMRVGSGRLQILCAMGEGESDRKPLEDWSRRPAFVRDTWPCFRLVNAVRALRLGSHWPGAGAGFSACVRRAARSMKPDAFVGASHRRSQVKLAFVCAEHGASPWPL